MLLLAGASALWYPLTVHNELDRWPENGDAPAQAKVIAGVSLGLWVSIVFFGRFIVYWPPI